MAADGSVFIGYSAELRWAPLSISYASTLVHLDGEGTKVRTSLRKAPPPVLSPSGVRWNSRALGVRGDWSGGGESLGGTIYSSPEGEIRWTCQFPRAAAEIAVSGARIVGLGYVEHLDLSLPPWQIPIAELRWGRFLSDDEAVVWIDWRGRFETRIVYRNGVAVTAARIGDDGIELSGGTTIHFAESLVLRDGNLGSTVLRAIPGIERFAPARILATRECKWRSRAILSAPGAPEKRGWAIHEVVRWP